MWQTFTPDGLVLALRRTGAGWVASCLAQRAEAPTAEEAIRLVLRVENPSGDEKLEAWIRAHVAELDAAPLDQE